MTEKEFHAFVFDLQMNYVCPIFVQNEPIQFSNKNKGLTKVYRLIVRAERLKVCNEIMRTFQDQRLELFYWIRNWKDKKLLPSVHKSKFIPFIKLLHLLLYYFKTSVLASMMFGYIRFFILSLNFHDVPLCLFSFILSLNIRKCHVPWAFY